MLGLTGAAAFFQQASAQIRVGKPARELVGIKNPPQYISVELLRPHDLLALELRFYNFSLNGNSLQKKGNPAHMVVVFQPQSISEQAWFEDQDSLETPAPLPGRMLIGGESRLVFSIPSNISLASGWM